MNNPWFIKFFLESQWLIVMGYFLNQQWSTLGNSGLLFPAMKGFQVRCPYSGLLVRTVGESSQALSCRPGDCVCCVYRWSQRWKGPARTGPIKGLNCHSPSSAVVQQSWLELGAQSHMHAKLGTPFPDFARLGRLCAISCWPNSDHGPKTDGLGVGALS